MGEKMKLEFDKKIGDMVFHVTAVLNDERDFFKIAGFFSNEIPSKGPNGETDLVVSYKKTTEGHEYYSIVCKSAKMELKFGQPKDHSRLYPKGWVPIFEGDNNSVPTPAAAASPQTESNPSASSPPEASPTNSSEMDDILGEFGM